MTFKMILEALKRVLQVAHVERNLVESLMRYDFQISQPRLSLMQLCFSALAAWPVFLLILILQFLPTAALPPLYSFLGEQNAFVLFLLDTSLASMLSVFIFFFVIQWLIRSEHFLIGLVVLMLLRFELHVVLALVSCWAILLSRNCYLWWAVLDIKSETRHIWNRVNQIQLTSLIISASVSLYLLDFILSQHLFVRDSLLSRANFIGFSFLLFYFLLHILLSVWGHFYFQKQQDPSSFPVFYSTAFWLLRFKIKPSFRLQMKEKVKQAYATHLQHAEKFADLKNENNGITHLPFEKVLSQEIAHLKEAQHRLDLI